MAGFEEQFQSRAYQYGATANTRGGGQFPKGLFSSPLPAVSANFGMESNMLYANSHTLQVSPTRQPLGWATMLPSLGRKSSQADLAQRTKGVTTTLAGAALPAPKPNASLVARLSTASAKAILESNRKSNVKSVESTPRMFRARFSGDTSDD